MPAIKPLTSELGADADRSDRAGWRAPPARALLSRAALLALLAPATAHAVVDSLSVTGTLASPTSVSEQTFTVPVAEAVTIQTYGFGGGTNAAGDLIAPGGFDPAVSLFSGSGSGASIVLSGGDPAASSDLLSLFSPGCPPAGMDTIGTGLGATICGDDQLVISLDAGVYTLVLTVAAYLPLAVTPGPPTNSLLSDGFGSLGVPSFQTCNTTSDGTTCAARTSDFAVDILAGGVVPEPGSFAAGAAGLGAVAARRRRLRRPRA